LASYGLSWVGAISVPKSNWLGPIVGERPLPNGIVGHSGRSGRIVASLDRKRLGARQLGRRRELRAEAFSIRRLEGSRWRLRRTRQLWELNASLVLSYYQHRRLWLSDSGFAHCIHQQDATATCGSGQYPQFGETPDQHSTRSVRRASGFVLVGYSEVAHDQTVETSVC
jgi:hypothetical protein